MAILVSAGFDATEWAAWWPLLQAALPGEQLVREPHDIAPGQIEIALVANPPVGSLRGLPNLRLIQSLWAGVDRLLDDASVPVDVPLARMVDPAMNETMAQTALWAVAGLQRGFFDYAAQQRAGVWRQHPLRRADEFAVTVLGAGQMGQATARRLAEQGHPVTVWRRDAGPLDAALAKADAVVNLLPLTPQTHGLFDARMLAQMPRGASLLNFARGAHVVEADLLAALDSGHLRRAVLDVFATEPLPPAHPFWSHPAITVLPHIAAPTDPLSAAVIAARNVEALRNGQALQNVVDRTRGY
ncbi:MAG: glyoxylate/hydroxypyruvate reductase A [Pseudomonadota bacterium]